MQDVIQTINPEDMPGAVAVYGLLSMLTITGLILDIILLVRLRRKPLNSPDLTIRLQSRPWTWNGGGMILLILAILNGYLLLSINAGYHLRLLTENEILFLSLFLQTLLFHGAGLIAIIFFMRSQKISWQKAFGVNPRDFLKNIQQGVIFYIAAAPIVAFYSLVYMKLLEYLGFPIDKQDVIKLFIDPSRPVWLHVYLGVIAIIMAPFVEELIFRGIALPVLVKHMKFMPAVCFVSLVFAVMHFHLASIGPLFILAVAFSLGYLYSGSILVPIVMHTLFNGTSLIAVFLIRDLPQLALCR